MNKLRFPLKPMLLCIALACNTAMADEGITYKVSGYGTLAATMIDKSDLQMRSSLSQSKGANKTLDLGVDSRLGLQGVVNFGQGWSATGQLLAIRRRTDGTTTSNKDFDIGIEWLFGQYSVNSNLDLRLGRVVLPAFMISDSRNVGYSQPWLRAPMEVYGRMPLTTMDGVQAVWRIPVGNAMISVQPSYGKAHTNISQGSVVIDSPSDWVASLSAQLEWSDWLLRAGQVRNVLPFSAPLLAPFTNTPISYTMKDKFTNLGLQYDNGKAIVMAEVATRDQNDMPSVPNGLTGMDLLIYQGSPLVGKPLAKESMWYAAAGWRFGKWLPMVSYGSFKNKSATQPTQWNSTNLSLRYDAASNVAVKFQIGQHEAKDSSTFVTANSNDPRSVTSLSFGVDFVF